MSILPCFGWTFVATAGVLATALRMTPACRAPRHSHWDTAWFTPVYLWGLEALVVISTSCAPDGSCFGPVVTTYLSKGLRIFGIGAVVLGVCLVAEWNARRRGLSARPRSGSVPLPVVAAWAMVLINWAGGLMGFLPLPRG